MKPSALSLLGPILMVSVHAGAEEPNRAADLVRRGVELRRENRNEEALAVFKEATTLSTKPSIRAQLGLAEQAVGRWIDAERDLNLAVTYADDPWIARNLAALEGARAVVREHLAWLTVEADAELKINGELATSGVEQRVVAGSCAIEAHGRGHAPTIRALLVAPGEHARLILDMKQPDAAPPESAVTRTMPSAPPAPSPERPTAPRAEGAARPPVAPFVVLGIGVAGLATGTYFGLRAINAKGSEMNAIQVRDATAANESYENAKASSVAATVAFSVGVAATAAGLTWWLFTRKSEPARLSVAPAWGAMSGVVLRGTL